MSDKQTASEAIRRCPDEVSFREMSEEIRFLSAVREGGRQADQGKVISMEQTVALHASLIAAIQQSEESEGLEPGFRREIQMRVGSIESDRAEGVDAIGALKKM